MYQENSKEEKIGNFKLASTEVWPKCKWKTLGWSEVFLQNSAPSHIKSLKTQQRTSGRNHQQTISKTDSLVFNLWIHCESYTWNYWSLPIVTCLTVRKECISWTSLISWASPNVKYATSLPASAAAINWISAEKQRRRGLKGYSGYNLTLHQRHSFQNEIIKV